jgi:hypothetical protein
LARHGASLSYERVNGELQLELLGADGQTPVELATASASPDQVLFAGLPAGTYYLHVSGQSGAVNRYDLSLDVPVSTDPVQNVQDWTVLVYLTTGRLPEKAYNDVNELEKAAMQLPGSVSVAVLWDQSSKLTTYATGNGTQAAWGTVGRGLVVADRSANIATPFEVLPEQDTGAGGTLQDFLVWAQGQAPARHYALILWDDGKGLDGFNYDDADTGQAADNLTTGELVAALQAPGVPHMNLLSFDANAMAMTEVGYAVRQLTDVFVGSEELIAPAGYDYTTVLKPLYVNPGSVSAEQLATGMVRSYEASYAGKMLTTDTQSAVRTSGFAVLAEALGNFTDLAVSADDHDKAVLGAARDAAIVYTFGARDLGSFMTLVAEHVTDEDLRQAAQGVVEALSGMVLAKSADTRGSSGLAIYLPTGAVGTTYAGTDYDAFDSVTGWSSFLQTLPTAAGALGPDWAERNEVPAQAYDLHTVRGAGLTFPNLTISNVLDTDWFRFTTDGEGGTTDRVSVTAGTGAGVTVELWDPTGTTQLEPASGAGVSSVSLAGHPAGEYLLRVVGSQAVTYGLTIDAPAGTTAEDWAGTNDTSAKAYQLGVISSQSFFSGLSITEGQDDWYTIETPRMAEPTLFTVTVSVTQGQVVSAELLDTQQHVLAAASGSVLVTLSHVASGAGESYLVHIRTGSVGSQGEAEPNTAASYSLLFQLQYKYWHNAAQPENVDGNEVVAAQDVLYVIDYINAHIGTAALPAPPAGVREPYYDVDNDSLCTAQDALYVINYINSQSVGQGEGEAGCVAGTVAARTLDIPWEPAVLRPVVSAVSSVASGVELAAPQVVRTALAERPIATAAGPRQASVRSARGSATDGVFRQPAAPSDLEDLLDEIAGDIDAVWQPRG